MKTFEKILQNTFMELANRVRELKLTPKDLLVVTTRYMIEACVKRYTHAIRRGKTFSLADFQAELRKIVASLYRLGESPFLFNILVLTSIRCQDYFLLDFLL